MACLDRQRLGKQRVESWQIWLATQRTVGGWINHPAVRMWKGHEWWLLLYGMHSCIEWITRGYRDTMLIRFVTQLESKAIDPIPEWLGWDALHSSHRANLLRKDSNHYGQFGWSENPETQYVWPR